MPITLLIKNARLSFSKNLFTPTEKKGNRPGKRACNLIVSKDTQFVQLKDGKKIPLKREDLDKVVEEALKEKFGGKAPKKFENWAIRDNTGAVNATSGERYQGYEDDDGVYFAPTRYEDQGPPAYVRRDATVLNPGDQDELEEAKRTFYAGCYVNAKINLAGFEIKEENVTKRGVTSFLEAVQFLKKGEEFGGGSANADGFDDLGEDPDEDEDDDEL